jgi:predicted MPP superfamily phosphohydrolase
MKIISIGDIHGRKTWKQIDPSKYDKVIFVGDYVDSFDVQNEDMLSNLLDIIQFKKDNMDKVVLLLGNHDIQYMFHPEFRCSGFRATMLASLYPLFNENRSLFQCAYQIDNYLWTHAGISNSWYKKYEEYFASLESDETIASRINEISNSSKNWILHEVGAIRGGLRYDEGGITWADRSETLGNSLNGYHQIVGHTPIAKITTFGNESTSITYIDTKEFYESEIK